MRAPAVDRRVLPAFRRRLLRDLWQSQGGRCLLCGRAVERDPPSIDSWRRISLEHAVPLARGGSNGVRNLAVSHRICNKNRGVDPLTKEQVARMVRWYGREGGERVAVGRLVAVRLSGVRGGEMKSKAKMIPERRRRRRR